MLGGAPTAALRAAVKPKETYEKLGWLTRSPTKELDDGWPESEKGTDVDVKYIEERRRCEKISEERMNI